MPITPTDFTDNKSATIQFSYPAVDNVVFDKTTASFFLPNNSVAPNFSYTDGTNNLYISGATVKGYISNAGSYIKSNPELVLEHLSANTASKFYVIIPLVVNSSSKSTLNNLKSGSKALLDLNKDIPAKNAIYHFIDQNNIHFFVFDKPITTKTSLSGQSISEIASTTPNGQKYKITSNTKVEDEIVCDYSEEVPQTKESDKNLKTLGYSVTMLLINVVIITVGLQLIISYRDVAPVILSVIFCLACLVLAALIYYNLKKLDLLIIYGSLGVTSVFMCIISFWAIFNKSFIKMWLQNTTVPKTLAVAAAAAVAPAAVEEKSKLSKYI